MSVSRASSGPRPLPPCLLSLPGAQCTLPASCRLRGSNRLGGMSLGPHHAHLTSKQLDSCPLPLPPRKPWGPEEKRFPPCPRPQTPFQGQRVSARHTVSVKRLLLACTQDVSVTRGPSPLPRAPQ